MGPKPKLSSLFISEVFNIQWIDVCMNIQVVHTACLYSGSLTTFSDIWNYGRTTPPIVFRIFRIYPGTRKTGLGPDARAFSLTLERKRTYDGKREAVCRGVKENHSLVSVHTHM